MWKQFMQGATANLPALDFTPPDEHMWPSAQYIDETGRKVRVFVPPPTLPPATTPAATAPATPGDTKPAKGKTPKTTPPKTDPGKPPPSTP
jgi:hypothetical protein